MTEKIIIAGAGGQGIMLLGKVLAEAAMREGNFVTWMPSYGAEVRGGTAHCMVILSDKEISSPYIDKADILIVMNRPSLEKFRSRISNHGLLIMNSSLVSADGYKNARNYKYPFTEIALRLGNIRVANMIALGALVAKKKLVSLKSVLEAISSIAPKDKKDLVEINIRALKKGAQLR
ncbi:MAG: 2-oxoacid:acceptor oxidoreductase family protein [Candidatus Omnitrophica bacterium]|nr:2-oxoacid:acceptor oxidoreductase family protein [Candidatus Omnitrophota bacterium]